jgi:hypothetical protein
MHKAPVIIITLAILLIIVSSIETSSVSKTSTFTIKQTTDCYSEINVTIIYLHDISINISKTENAIQIAIPNNYSLSSNISKQYKQFIEKYDINNTAIYNILYPIFNSNSSYLVTINNTSGEIAIVLITVRVIHTSSSTVPNSSATLRSLDNLSTANYYPYAIVVIISIITTLLLRHIKRYK